MTHTGTSSDMWVGVTIGFAIAFVALHGVEYCVDYFTAYQELDEVKVVGDVQMPEEVVENVLIPDTLRHHRTKVVAEDGEELLDNPTVSIGEWDPADVEFAAEAINRKTHREHILEHFQEIRNMVNEMEKNSDLLIDREMTVIEAELLAEQVDESIHMLQYKLDHCRRLLQGSEVGKEEKKTSWLTNDKKETIVKEMDILGNIVEHLMGHLSSEHFTPLNIQEIHDHLEDMDRQIHTFHISFERWSWKWKRNDLVETSLGDVIPRTLVIPVVIDCFVDGFLIGVTIAISARAGYLLAAANCLEMGSLGMAYSSRIAKCTGSSLLRRQFAVLIPPIIMLLASGLGAAVAGYSENTPAAFVIFVSFGVFALVTLVFSELIIEARNVQEAVEKWWIELFIFLGVYVVLMVEPIF